MALAEVKDDLSRFLRLAAKEEIVITRHGRPAGALIGFASEDDWFDCRLEHHPEFLRRIAEARALALVAARSTSAAAIVPQDESVSLQQTDDPFQAGWPPQPRPCRTTAARRDVHLDRDRLNTR